MSHPRPQHPPAAGLVASAVFLFLCATAQAAAPPGNGLGVSGAWMRFIMPSRPAAGYFTLSNDSPNPRMLTGASSPACAELMLHRSLQEGAMDSMEMVARVPVPAHGSVSFAPGGYHLMCVSPSRDMVPGHSVSVTLHFADQTTVTTYFPVRNAAGK